MGGRPGDDSSPRPPKGQPAPNDKSPFAGAEYRDLVLIYYPAHRTPPMENKELVMADLISGGVPGKA